MQGRNKQKAGSQQPLAAHTLVTVVKGATNTALKEPGLQAVVPRLSLLGWPHPVERWVT